MQENVVMSADMSFTQKKENPFKERGDFLFFLRKTQIFFFASKDPLYLTTSPSSCRLCLLFHLLLLRSRCPRCLSGPECSPMSKGKKEKHLKYNNGHVHLTGFFGGKKKTSEIVQLQKLARSSVTGFSGQSTLRVLQCYIC